MVTKGRVIAERKEGKIFEKEKVLRMDSIGRKLKVL